jgi:hypothetical protein
MMLGVFRLALRSAGLRTPPDPAGGSPDKAFTPPSGRQARKCCPGVFPAGAALSRATNTAPRAVARIRRYAAIREAGPQMMPGVPAGAALSRATNTAIPRAVARIRRLRRHPGGRPAMMPGVFRLALRLAGLHEPPIPRAAARIRRLRRHPGGRPANDAWCFPGWRCA